MWAAMNRTGELMVSWSTWAGGMKVWHPTTRRLLLSMPNQDVGFTHAAADGRLAGYRIDGTRIQLWVLEPARECRTLVRDPLRPPMQEYRLNSIHKSGRLAAAGTANGVTLFDLAAGLDVGYLPIGLNWNVAFDPVSGDLLTSGQMGVMRWPVQSVAEAPGRWTIGPPKSLPIAVTQMDHAVRISKDGTTISAAQGHQALILHQNEPAKRVILPMLEIRREIALSADGRWAATGKFARVGNLRVWSTSDGALAKDFGDKTGMNVAISPDGQWLLANDETHYRFFRMGTWEPGPQAPIPYKYWEGEPAFSPDSQLVALERGDGAVRLIETATGRELAVLEDLQQGRSTPISFSADGAQLLLTNKDQLVLRVWDLRKLRVGLETLGLDWHAPAYPGAAANAGAAVPLTLVEVK
jgi:WD40 repeat protein